MARRLPEATSHGVEAQILLGCARAHLEPGTRERIARLVDGAPDWSALIELADSHALLPLLYRHLNDVAPASVPQRAMIELWGRHEVTARRNRSMAGELVEIVDALDANGVDSLPYKGPALAVQLYADVALREFCDLDILLRARDVSRAKEILRGLGYLPEYPLEPVVEAAFLHAPSQYHLVLARAGGPMVELHWKTDADFPIERGDDGWWAGLERARLGDRMLRAFGSSELLLVLCLHGSKHGWGRLAWLADVGEILRGNGNLEWDWIFARAQSLGCMRRVALGLHLAHELLDAPMPATVERRMADYPGVAQLAARIERSMFMRNPAPLNALQGLHFNLSLYERASHRVAHVVNTIWEPSLVEWMRWPLPRALFFLYPPLRLMRLVVKYGGARDQREAPAKPA